ncbi:ribosome maturation factor RimP [Flavobacteriaceae bacterium MAR_2010_188]|nr:ribosome maturation factor RimP [Flavobacteriaceae bacterium MAR_2010_188]
MFKDLVEELLMDALAKREDLFLIDFEILADNTIRVILDGDDGITVDDCVYISRAIEHNIDREEYDFSLEVTSAGAASPLVHKRQYNKNIGRDLEIKTKQGETVEGTLSSVGEDSILLKWKTREPKPVGKGKVTIKKQAEIEYGDIETAKVIIKF